MNDIDNKIQNQFDASEVEHKKVLATDWEDLQHASILAVQKIRTRFQFVGEKLSPEDAEVMALIIIEKMRPIRLAAEMMRTETNRLEKYVRSREELYRLLRLEHEEMRRAGLRSATRLQRLESALEDTAKQMTSAELSAVGWDAMTAPDFEGAHDEIVNMARKALAESSESDCAAEQAYIEAYNRAIQAAREYLQIGIENTQELLDRLDCDYGRTTRRNRIEAERLESDIEKMKEAISSLENPDYSSSACSAEVAERLYALLEYYFEFAPASHGMSRESYHATAEGKRTKEALDSYRKETGAKDTYVNSMFR